MELICCSSWDVGRVVVARPFWASGAVIEAVLRGAALVADVPGGLTPAPVRFGAIDSSLAAIRAMMIGFCGSEMIGSPAASRAL